MDRPAPPIGGDPAEGLEGDPGVGVVEEPSEPVVSIGVMPAGGQAGEGAADLGRLGVGEPDEIHQGRRDGLDRPAGPDLAHRPGELRGGGARKAQHEPGEVPGAVEVGFQVVQQQRGGTGGLVPGLVEEPECLGQVAGPARLSENLQGPSANPLVVVAEQPGHEVEGPPTSLGPQPLQFPGEDRRVAVPERAPGRGVLGRLRPGVGRDGVA